MHIDDLVPAPYNPRVDLRPGDLWRLGVHYVLCGDATRMEDIRRLMAGKKAHMVFTDPPYNEDERVKAG